MNRATRILVEPKPRAELLRIEPRRFFGLLENLDSAKLILRSNQGTLFRSTQFGVFVSQEDGVLVDLVSGLFVDPKGIEAIYRVCEGGRETFEIEIEGMGIPLAIVPERSLDLGGCVRGLSSIPVERVIPLEMLRMIGAGTWLDESLPFQPEEEFAVGVSKSSFGEERFDLKFASTHIGIAIQLQVTYSDRDGSCVRLYDASSESVVFLRSERRAALSQEMREGLLAC
ncbi:MAG: hypothetical protein CMO55_13670 [Verrucomicrobiales bacterium]|nr:hypothetical protein [Verrucomicrobiales bacterium]